MRLVSLADGTETRSIELGGYVGASAAVYEDAAFVGNFENQVLGLDLARGEVAWVYDPPEASFPFYSSAATNGSFVVLGGRDKRVHALDPASGEAIWTMDAQHRIDSSPVIAGERVYVATQGGDLLSLNLETGSSVWKFETGEGFSASPALANGFLVIGSLDGTLYGFGTR